ncbi:hypothetical protein C8J57DRAFT_1643538 [Mycena rebaudengoi]|nr:hypothetical protein C8J57DRAFT_1643538 [Mycena rebaudengoi]
MDDSQDTSSGRYLCSALRASISELYTRILSLKNSFAAARGEQEKLQSRLDDYKYPVLTLPAEITSEIFFHFLPIYPLCSPITGLVSPAFLGQIGRQWRDITFGTPRLWSSIEIKIYSDIPDFFSARVDLLQTWLARFKTYTILMHSARLQYAGLFIPFDHLHWSGLQGPFPLLRDVTLKVSDYHVPEDAVAAFCDTPTLTTVHLIHDYTHKVELPWSQLTTISVEHWQILHVADILRKAVALVNFSGTVWDGADDTEIMRPLLHLPSLILFEQSYRWRATRKLLGALAAPALRHLTVSDRKLESLSFDTIASLITRSQCFLESLQITRCERYEEADVYALFPSI